jgi:hypothetical protein
MKTEVSYFSEITVNIYKTTQHRILGDRCPQQTQYTSMPNFTLDEADSTENTLLYMKPNPLKRDKVQACAISYVHMFSIVDYF